MRRYVVSRLGFSLFVLIGVVTVVFFWPGSVGIQFYSIFQNRQRRNK